MQRVLSFPPQSNRRFGDPGEFVSKRMCFSFMFSITFLAVLGGFLLGRFVFDQELELSKAKLRKANLQISTYRPSPQHNVSSLVGRIAAASLERPPRLSSESSARLVLTALQDAQFDVVSPLVESRVNLSFPDGDNQVLIMRGEEVHLTLEDCRSRMVTPEGQRSSTTVTGNVYYVNFGRDEDYHYLDTLGLGVRGSVVIARVGRSPTVDLVTNALEHEAAGIVLYRDPQQRDVGGEVLSAVDLARLRSFLNVEAVPVLCITPEDAERLFREMSTSESSSESWRGDLNSSYPIGPGLPDGQLVLRVTTRTTNRKFFDVFGAVHGSHEPDRFVLVAQERRSGDGEDSTAIVTELVRALGDLKSKGWRPHRSIIVASWGMEAERRPRRRDSWAEFKTKTVAYLKIDSARLGNASTAARGSPILERAFREAARAASMAGPALDPMLQTGADVTLVESGVPFIELKEPEKGGVDRLNDVTSFWAVLTLRLAESSGLPFGLDTYASFFNHSVNFIEHRFRMMGQKHRLFLESFFEATQRLLVAISSFQSKWSVADPSRYIEMRIMNDQLLRFSHVLSCHRDRSPDFKESFRHIIFSHGTREGDPRAGFGILQDLLRETTSTHAPDDLQQQIVNHLADLVECIDAARYALTDGLDNFLRPQE